MTVGTASAWVVRRLGAPTDALEIQTVEIGDPAAGQVRIIVDAFCLDFNDIDTIRGRYGLLKTWAKQLGYTDAAKLLDATLQEEKKADALLSQIAEKTVNAGT